jgi:hypothetical protein
VIDFGGTLAGTGGRDLVGFGGGLKREGREERAIVGFGRTLAGAGGHEIVGFGIRLAVLDFETVLTGAGVLSAVFTGTLADSGMSSQPASMSSAGLAAFCVSCREPSAPEAMSIRVPEAAHEMAASTARSFVGAHARISEPR